jgi:hypothetical protein
MTTKSAGRLYNQLTPRKRLPLLIAAARRDDAVEQQRLQYTAPTQESRLDQADRTGGRALEPRRLVECADLSP